MTLKTISIYTNLILLTFISVWFFIPKQASVRRETKPNEQEIARLKGEIQDLRKQARQDSLQKTRYLHAIDSLRKSKQPIIQIIRQQNAKIDSIHRLPAVLPDTSLLRILSNFEATPQR